MAGRLGWGVISFSSDSSHAGRLWCRGRAGIPWPMAAPIRAPKPPTIIAEINRVPEFPVFSGASGSSNPKSDQGTGCGVVTVVTSVRPRRLRRWRIAITATWRGTGRRLPTRRTICRGRGLSVRTTAGIVGHVLATGLGDPGGRRLGRTARSRTARRLRHSGRASNRNRQQENCNSKVFHERSVASSNGSSSACCYGFCSDTRGARVRSSESIRISGARAVAYL